MAEEQQSQESIIERLRNSPRTVSTIIVILIIAGAIFAFSDRGTKPSPSAEPSDQSNDQADANADQTPEASTSPTASASPASSAKPSATKTPEVMTKEMPKPSETADAFTEVAQKGDSLTTLSRRAAQRYLEANKPDFDVTNEHRVFIEDYVKDHLKRQAVRVGATQTIDKKVIADAVTASKKLTDAQRKHLQKYSSRVQWQALTK